MAYFYQGGYSGEYLESIPLPKLQSLKEHASKISQKLKSEMKK